MEQFVTFVYYKSLRNHCKYQKPEFSTVNSEYTNVEQDIQVAKYGYCTVNINVFRYYVVGIITEPKNFNKLAKNG